MNLTDIRNGSRVLLDSNILLYAAARHSRECVALVERIASGVVEACLSTVTVGEVCHRWMMEECRDRGIVLGGNRAGALAEKRQVITQLTNDSLQLAVAERMGINEIASADKGFDAVQGLIVYKPADLSPNAQ